MAPKSIGRGFLILRYTLIVATTYLLLVEDHFAIPPPGTVVLVALALASNVVIAQLPAHILTSTGFGLGIILCDTAWITGALLQSGRFDAEFFYLYFFILLLAGIGENLRLIAVGAVAVCVAYIYVLAASGESWSLWNSPSLIRIPFLFTAAAFYGHLIERTRSERWRADVVETARQRTEAELLVRTEQLRDEAEGSAALARIGKELISSLDAPVILDRVCQLTAHELCSDSSQTLLWRGDAESYVPVAAYGLAAEERELAYLLRIPAAQIADVLHRLERDDLVLCGGIVLTARTTDRKGHEAATQVFMALRRGQEIIGVQVATWDRGLAELTRSQQRVARGIAQLASMALENARLVEELEAANRLKSDFVASMSHELRTPLNLIIGYNDLLLDSAFGELTAEQADTLRRMGRSSRELLKLIEATLDLSRLEAKRVPLDLRDVSLGGVLREIDIETRPWRDKPAVSFAWTVHPADAAVRTDPVKLKMVLKNLVSNALKFTLRGSVGIAARHSDGGMEISVTDTGIGIAPEVQETVFEPFRQADRTISAEYGGAGLGLYIVRRLLDLLGGRISLESALGHGTTFRVWIPSDAKPATISNDPETRSVAAVSWPEGTPAAATEAA